MSFGIETFAPPLKCKLPLLEYDIASTVPNFASGRRVSGPNTSLILRKKSFLTLGSLSGLSLK